MTQDTKEWIAAIAASGVLVALLWSLLGFEAVIGYAVAMAAVLLTIPIGGKQA